LVFSIVIFFICIGAGLIGALVGMGGGFVIVPVLTLFFHVDIRLAIGASIVAVIATSSGAAISYVREGMTNLRVGMFLEIGTTLGAVSGAILAGYVHPAVLFIVFGLILAYSAIRMYWASRPGAHVRPLPADAWADKLKLHSTYVENAGGEEKPYQVGRTKLGLSLMYGAGLISGLLGIGSGVLKVPAMDMAMGLPIKVSTATSNFMIGVTAAASAGVYLLRGDVDPYITAPVAVGILCGAVIGSRLLTKISTPVIRLIFMVIMIVVAVDMLYKGIA
jgi:hypothetical protein